MTDVGGLLHRRRSRGVRSGRLCSGRGVAVTELLATGREGRQGSNAGDDLEGRGGASKEQLEERQQVAETADCLRPQGRTLTAELCRERPPRAEQQHLDRGGRRSEPLGDLTVREAVPLAEEDRAARRRRAGSPCDRHGYRAPRGSDRYAATQFFASLTCAWRRESFPAQTSRKRYASVRFLAGAFRRPFVGCGHRFVRAIEPPSSVLM